MKKRSGIIGVIIFAVITVLLGYTAIFGWGPTGTGSFRNIKTGLDLSGGVSITYQTVDPNPSAEDMSDTIYKLQQRVDNFSTESSVYQQGLNRINIEIPGVSDANTILAELGKPGSLSFTDTEGNVVVEGTDIIAAEAVTNSDNTTTVREYNVELEFTEEGTEKFAEATTANVGNIIYINYDNEVISAPTVRTPITDGKAVITGMEDMEEAQNLASFIRIGSLSLELEEIYSNVVGASLGQEALSTSLIAGIIGIFVVILFMIIVYRISGLASGWALILFVLLDLILMNAFDVTLTLPGVAGVILTIGMAVDANVIIYARSLEEMHSGRGIYSSLKTGFKKAFSAIFDGNITTLIAAIVLFALGTGSIRGFAITLAIGVVLSMFSSLVLSRFLSYSFYSLGARSERSYGKIKMRKPFNFVGHKKIFFIIAIVFVALAPIGMGVNAGSGNRALNFSLDFIGGTATTVDFGEAKSLEELDKDVKPVVAEITGDQNIQFQRITGSNQVMIKTRELSVEERTELDSALAENFSGVDEAAITAENISATMSNEMRDNAIRAVIIAVICMLVYIWFRFRDIRFSSSAIIALIHDILVVIMFYAIFRLSVGNTFIAVMLTILGYSVNSTIVIFDRIRENMKSMSGSSMKTIVNASITQTLTRNIYSSLTTFITIFVLFIMGVPSVKEFALPIIIGLIAGAFSSIFVTGPLWYVFKTRIGKFRATEQKLLADEQKAAGSAETSEKTKAVTDGNGKESDPAPAEGAKAGKTGADAGKEAAKTSSVKKPATRKRKRRQ